VTDTNPMLAAPASAMSDLCMCSPHDQTGTDRKRNRAHGSVNPEFLIATDDIKQRFFVGS
jgi:hypothetical protein